MDDSNDHSDIWTSAVFKKENMPEVLPILDHYNKLVDIASYFAGIGYKTTVRAGRAI